MRFETRWLHQIMLTLVAPFRVDNGVNLHYMQCCVPALPLFDFKGTLWHFFGPIFSEFVKTTISTQLIFKKKLNNCDQEFYLDVFVRNVEQNKRWGLVSDGLCSVKKRHNPFDFLLVHSSAEQCGWEEFAIIDAAQSMKIRELRQISYLWKVQKNISEKISYFGMTKFSTHSEWEGFQIIFRRIDCSHFTWTFHISPLISI